MPPTGQFPGNESLLATACSYTFLPPINRFIPVLRARKLSLLRLFPWVMIITKYRVSRGDRIFVESAGHSEDLKERN